MKKYLSGLMVCFALFGACAVQASPQTVLAEQLLIKIGMQQQMQATIEELISVQVGQTPDLERFRPELQTFYNKYMSYQAIKPELIRLYAQNFSTEELQMMNQFYGSAVGQKVLYLMPDLSGKASMIGIQRVQQHQQELVEMIKRQ